MQNISFGNDLERRELKRARKENLEIARKLADDVHDLINSYSHISTIKTACLKLQTIIEKLGLL